MTTKADERARAARLRMMLAITPFVAAVAAACVEVEPTEVPGGSAGAAAIGGTTGGAGGTGGGTGGATGGVGASAGTAGVGVGGAAAGTGGTLDGVGGAVGGSAGVGGALGAAGGSAGAVGGSGGAVGGSAGSGGALGGAAGAGGTTGGSAGQGAGGAGGALPATDRMTAWNDANYGCGNCHGENGEGIVDRGPEITHPNREVFDFMVRNGDAMPLPAYRDPMKKVGPELISDAILTDIYTWLNSFPKPTTGAELFADYCSYCHGADGRGGTQAYAKTSHSAPFEKKGADFLAAVRSGHVKSGAGGSIPVSDRGEWMPAIPASVVTDAEVALIEAWLPKN